MLSKHTKKCKNALKTYFFWRGSIFAICKYLYNFVQLNINYAQMNGKKEDILSELWLYLYAKDGQRKIAILGNKIHISAQKGLQTPEQSTRNFTLYEINMGWEKKK